jgi:hypothetical protein
MTTTNITQCDRRGDELSVYYNTGTCETPVWVFHKTVVGDVSVADTDDENSSDERDPDQLYKTYSPGKSDLAITGTITVDPGYEGDSLFMSMRPGGEPADLLVLTGPIDEVGNVGYRGAFWNLDRSIEAPNSGNMRRSFNLRPASCADCMVRPVRVESANSVEDYDPAVFEPAS